jgi:hypothetical protein
MPRNRRRKAERARTPLPGSRPLPRRRSARPRLREVEGRESGGQPVGIAVGKVHGGGARNLPVHRRVGEQARKAGGQRLEDRQPESLLGPGRSEEEVRRAVGEGHAIRGEPVVKLIRQAGRLLFFRDCGCRHADEAKDTPAFPPETQPLECDSDPLHVCLVRSDEEHGGRLARERLAIRRRKEERPVEGLADVLRGTKAERVEFRGESLRDRELACWQSVSGLDLLAPVSVKAEAAFVALAQVKDDAARSFHSGRHRCPEGGDPDIRPGEFDGLPERGTIEADTGQRKPCGRRAGRND